MCRKQISTDNGVLTCDRKDGHEGRHHAKHPGNRIRCINPDDTRHTEENQHQREGCMVTNPPLELEWPQEPRPEK